MENKLAGLKVAAIVANSCKADARVIKEAESLVRNGAEVTVFCLEADDVPNEQTINGVHYKRFAKKWINQSHSLLWASAKRVFANENSGLLYSAGIVLVYLMLTVCMFLVGFASVLYRSAIAVIRFVSFKKYPSSIIGDTGRRASFLKKLSGLPFFQSVFVFVKYDMYGQIWHSALVAYRPDIIHAHDFDTVPVALCVAKKVRAKVVFDAHEIEVDREGKRKTRGQLAIIDWIIRKNIKAINGFVTTCPSSTSFYFNTYGLHGIPECVVYNTVGCKAGDEHNNPLTDVKAFLGLEASSRLAMYTGAIRINRGVKEIATALKPLPDVHFCIMGPQTDEITADFMAHVRDLGIENRVHIIPPVPYKDVSATIRTADVGVCFTKPTCLNHLYSTPNKLFEMLMAGLPMVVPDLPEMGRIVKEEGVGVTVEPENVEALTEAIRTVLEHPEKYRPSADRLVQIREKWSWDAQEKRLVDLYSQLIAA